MFLEEGEGRRAVQDRSEASENVETPNELSSSVRRIPQPGSAWPAPPRVKHQESTEVLVANRTASFNPLQKSNRHASDPGQGAEDSKIHFAGDKLEVPSGHGRGGEAKGSRGGGGEGTRERVAEASGLGADAATWTLTL
ncbi:uncharacterized protein LOC143673206 [Tamandua tetradactyla]|uniref:uncharacterized protein LOC143673206 n=1 Tax=Tamandua tetradactyla TaxID=48850 RepID=UPI0040538FEA